MVKFSKSFILYFLILVIVGFNGEIIIAFSTAFLHELVHYFIARKLGYYGLNIEVIPIGTSLSLKNLDEASLKEDIIISASGPVFNLVISAFFYFIYAYVTKNSIIYLVFSSNLIIGIFNLLPALPLDGGRIFRDILCKKNYYKKANKIAVNISMGIGLMFLCFYFLLFYNEKADIYNISLGIIAIFIILYSIKEKERAVYFIMNDIIKKKYKFLKKGYMDNRSISVYYKKDLLFLVNMIEKNTYNIFYVLNENMDIINVIDENELIEALKKYGNIELKEYYEK